MTYGKVIGVGNTATVYEWGKDKVLKLFYLNYPKEAIENEFHSTTMIRNMDFEKPKAYEIVNLKKRGEILKMIDGLPDGNTLCHGDFHPGNLLIWDGHTMVIDFMNVCHGNFLYDVARTVFLVEYTPVPMEAGNREILLPLKKTLADLYLMQMNVTREMIQD